MSVRVLGVHSHSLHGILRQCFAAVQTLLALVLGLPANFRAAG